MANSMKLEINPVGMGLMEATNDDIILFGGARSGSSGPGLTRRRFTAYDKKDFVARTENGEPEEEVMAKTELGVVDLFVRDGTHFDVEGLVNIELKPHKRKKGFGRKIIDAIRETTGNELEIYSIKKHMATAWRRLGVTLFHDGRGEEGKLVISKISPKRHLRGTIPAIEMKKEMDYESDGMDL